MNLPPPTELDPTQISKKSNIAALLLCIFLGTFGAHRFYVGKMGTALLMLITLGGFGIWNLFDLIIISCQDFRDIEGKRLIWDTPLLS